MKVTFTILCIVLITYSCQPSKENHEVESVTVEETEIDSITLRYVNKYVAESIEISTKSQWERRSSHKDSGQVSTNRLLKDHLFYINNDLVPKEEYVRRCSTNIIGHVSKTLKLVTEPQATINDISNKPSIDKKDIPPVLYFNTIYKAYTMDYISDHLLNIEHIDLILSKHNLLYLSLGSNTIGAMNTQVYDVNYGHLMASYVSNDYDGSYYTGINISNGMEALGLDDVKELGKLRAVVVIDNRFHVQDFKVEDIIIDKE